MYNCPEGKICFSRELFVIISLFIISLIIFGLAKNPLDLNVTMPEYFFNKNKIIKSNNSLMNPNQFYYLEDNKLIPKKTNNHFNTQLNNIPNNISNNISNNIPNNINTQFNIPNNINTQLNIPNNINTQANIPNNIPINIPTRGFSTDFKQIGILHSKNKKNSNDQKILPLFGKQKYPGSTKWQYYTNTDSFNSLKIPIIFKGKKCMEEFGCDELSDGDTVRVPAYGQAFRVSLYGQDNPTYIPYIN